MKSKRFKIAGVIALAFALMVVVGACSPRTTTPDTFDADVTISGIESEDHVDAFTLADADGSYDLEDFDYDDGTLTGVIAELENTVELTLTVNNDAVEDGSYEPETQSVEVTADDSEADFAVEYTADVVEPDTYSVTFAQPDNGTLTAEVDGEAIDSGDEVEEGSDIDFTVDPDEDYEVDEWTVNGEVVAGETDNEYTLADLSADVDVAVVLAEVVVEPETYTVTFVDYDGTVLAEETVEEGEDATAPEDPEREGYTFIGWDTDFTNVTEDLTVTAEYEINTYTVTFADPDNGSLTAEVDGEAIDSGDEVEEGSDIDFTVDPDEGYEVDEWTVNDETVADETAETFTLADLSEDVDVAVALELKSYEVTFADPDNGSLTAEVDGEEIDSGDEVDHGLDVVFTVDPDDGYEVDEWTVNGEVVDGETAETFTLTVEEDVEVAVALELKSYTVTFDPADGDFVDSDEDTIEVTVVHGETIDESDFPKVEKDGFRFDSWNTAEDGEGDEFTDDDAVTEDITVYAQYEQNDDLTLEDEFLFEVDEKFGSYAIVEGSLRVKNHVDAETLVLPSDLFVHDGGYYTRFEEIDLTDTDSEYVSEENGDLIIELPVLEDRRDEKGEDLRFEIFDADDEKLDYIDVEDIQQDVIEE